jgi:hypothetical protein
MRIRATAAGSFPVRHPLSNPQRDVFIGQQQTSCRFFWFFDTKQPGALVNAIREPPVDAASKEYATTTRIAGTSDAGEITPRPSRQQA